MPICFTLNTKLPDSSESPSSGYCMFSFHNSKKTPLRALPETASIAWIAIYGIFEFKGFMTYLKSVF